MILYGTLALLFSVGLVYLGMKKVMITLGFSALRQRKDHKQKKWKTEKAIVPIQTDKGANFQIETDVKWCPTTDEIFYRNPKEGGMFSKDWIKVSEYSDLYKRLRSNFRQKYEQAPRPKQGRRWTTFN
jgi:hypothetical protein